MDFGYFMIYRVILTIVPLLILGIIALNLLRSLRQWNKDNHSPRLTVPATIVSKRADLRRRKNTHRTWYYATFQFESGDRMELQMQGHEYGLIVEGDRGSLTFQGSRFLGFERT